MIGGPRRELSPEQARMKTKDLAATLPPGTGVSIAQYQPFWDVVARNNDGTIEYIVTDSSRPGQKPLVVHGPVRTPEPAKAWAMNTANWWRSTHLMTPEGLDLIRE